jgi:hypothetical protein
MSVWQRRPDRAAGGLKRNFIRRLDLERELESVGAIDTNGPGSVAAKLVTIATIKRENGLATEEAWRIVQDVCWRLDELGGTAFELAGCWLTLLRRGYEELRLREIAPYTGVRPPGVVARPEIAEELGMPLADTEALLKHVRRKEDILVPVGRRDYFLREAIARYVESGDVPERVMLVMGTSA